MFTSSTTSIDQLSWGSPLGIALLLIGLSLSFYLFSLAIQNFDAIERKRK